MALEDWLRRKAQRSPRLYRVLRALKRRLRESSRPREGPFLPGDGFRARIAVEGPLPAFNVGGGVRRVPVTVTNLSSRPWPGGNVVSLSGHWHGSDGKEWFHDAGRAELPQAVAPGAAALLECAIQPPKTPGGYVLELELVRAGGTSVGGRGSQAARLDVLVGGAQPDSFDDVDFERVYAAADLTKDFWTAVGLSSVEEFRNLGRYKLGMLQQLGLRPESKILDVGCGTGSLAEPLADFLSAEGLYYGTDLSEVAVRFCREKYARPNFLFAKNGMTTLPIDDLRFDFVVFLSVFTHTYPAETRDLLAEAVRVLGEGGTIVADVFESDIDTDSLGRRAMIVLDRRRMVGIADALGLESKTLFARAWDTAGPRRIDRMMRGFSKRAGAP